MPSSSCWRFRCGRCTAKQRSQATPTQRDFRYLVLLVYLAHPLQVLVMILLVSFIVYPTVWVLGEEGLEAISINMEVTQLRHSLRLFTCLQSGLYVLVDLVSKIVFGLYLLFAVLGSEEQDSEGTYSSHYSIFSKLTCDEQEPRRLPSSRLQLQVPKTLFFFMQ